MSNYETNPKIPDATQPEVIITSAGDEVYRYDLERAYQWHLSLLPFMDDLVQRQGWRIKGWDDLDDEDLGELADRLNLFAGMDPDLLQPELKEAVAGPADLAERLGMILIPPGTAPETDYEEPRPRHLSQEALILYDTEGETAALRYILDHVEEPPDRGHNVNLFRLPDGSAVARDSEKRGYVFYWPAGEASRSEQTPPDYPYDAVSAINFLLSRIEQQAGGIGDSPLTAQDAIRLVPRLGELAKEETDASLNLHQVAYEIVEEAIGDIALVVWDELSPSEKSRLEEAAAQGRTSRQ